MKIHKVSKMMQINLIPHIFSLVNVLGRCRALILADNKHNIGSLSKLMCIMFSPFLSMCFDSALITDN